MRAAFSALLVVLAVLQRAEDPVDFLRDVRPILAEHCFVCHGPDDSKGGLRLDTKAGALKDLGGYAAVVPGDLEESEIWWRIAKAAEDERMPPHDSGKSLSLEEVGVIRQWIESGADWKEHWGFAPFAEAGAPELRDPLWVWDAMDAYFLADLEASGDSPPSDASDSIWLRRVFFDVIGLPPSLPEREAFFAQPVETRRKWQVDFLLDSPHFGERWARHWLDLVRYSETWGHEFDIEIPNAWEYRDWVIRGFNTDVSWKRLVEEQVAGDILDPPRLNIEEGWNESILGTGFWLLGEEVHAPVDLEKDLADRTANKLDVMGKSILGMTLACARCHDHKFDPVSSRDYYALSGLVQSASSRQVRFQSLEKNKDIRQALDVLRTEQGGLVQAEALERLQKSWEGKRELEEKKAEKLSRPASSRKSLVWSASRDAWWADGGSYFFGKAGEALFTTDAAWPVHHFLPIDAVVHDPDWQGLRPAKESRPVSVTNLNWGGEGRTFRTPTFVLDSAPLWYLVRGKGAAFAPVEHHRIVREPLHLNTFYLFDTQGEWEWVRHPSLSDYEGMRAHFEFCPRGDGEWIGVAAIARGERPPFSAPAQEPRNQLLSTSRLLDEPSSRALDFYEKRKELLGDRVLESRLAPALLDGNGVDQPFLVRGQPSVKGDLVPRAFLERFSSGGEVTPPVLPDGHPTSGRLHLAEALFRDSEALIARVFVNRVWHYLFGEGIVKTTDNFGTLGSFPSNPDLLDHLALGFVESGWSLKSLVRRIVLSRTYGLERESRRLDAEAIRDSILAVSGGLDRAVGGPPVKVHLTDFMKGRGRPNESGPLDGEGRRSLYLEVRRNFLIPFLLVWDFPQPSTSMGRRSVSNVPSQALALMNDPFVIQQADIWSNRILAIYPDDETRIEAVWLEAYGRRPIAAEFDFCLDFLVDAKNGGWKGLCHALYNVKEFIYVP